MLPQLLEFKIKNFRSFYSEQVISFGDNAARSVTALFGANASGKSNTAKALNFFKTFISTSAIAGNVFNGIPLPVQFPNKPQYDPFLFKQDAYKEDSSFSIKFKHTDKIYIYAFSIDNDRITSEILKEQSNNSKKMKVVFKRDAERRLSDSAEKYGFGRKLVEKTRNETLLITKAREENNKYANIVFDLLSSVDVFLGEIPQQISYVMAFELFKKKPELKNQIIKLLNDADFSIRDFSFDETKGLNNQITVQTTTTHAVRDNERTVIGQQKLDFAQESMGTKKFFEIAAPIIEALDKGSTIYLDEFGAYLHPQLAAAVVEMFKSENINKSRAKLIINTHVPAILDKLAREDIVLVEKNLAEESVIIPLTDKSVRKDESFEKRYRQGIYGGVPIMSANLRL
ncbi:putative ATPases [Candidatus Termititenax aidoneus]|uniref:ATPases n=1 Tax=Termititenax aidoneus TaxID=2218524 RepID=A0A388TC44_TERA1|nr:putative ATPases [Candidatus Termititenax aidoneus]